MKLRELQLRYFRQHVDTSINFADGIIAILGENGAGKTTILEAIAFALFGSGAVRGKSEDLVWRSDKSKRKECEATLSFEIDGVIYRVQRKLGEAGLYVGGNATPLVTGSREVTEKLSTIIGMNYEEFKTTFFTEQKSLEFLSTRRGATERERFVMSMLGLDKIERMQELVREQRKEKKALYAGIESGLGERSALQSEIDLAVSEVAKLSAELAVNDNALQSAEREGIKAGKEFREIEARYQKDEALRTKHAMLSQELRAKEGEFERLKLVFANTEQFDPHLLEEASLELETVNKDRTMLTEQQNALHAAYVTEAARYDLQHEQLRGEGLLIQKRLSGLGTISESGDCPTCGQELGSNFDAIKRHLSDELKRNSERLAMLIKPVRDHGIAENEEKLTELNKKHTELMTKIAEYKGAAQRALHRELLEKQLQQLDAQIVTIKKGVSEQEALLKQAVAREMFVSAKVRFESAAKLVEVSRLQRTKTQGVLDAKNAIHNRAREALVIFDQRVKELETVKSFCLKLDNIDLVLSEFRTSVNAMIRPRLSEYASQYVAELTDGRYTAIELTQDYAPLLIEDGEVKNIISGGEEDVLNLCLRLALSSVVAERSGREFSLLVLDEIFGSLDTNRRTNVLTLLSRLRSRFSQVIIISHFEEIREHADVIFEIIVDESSGEARIIEAESPDLMRAIM